MAVVELPMSEAVKRLAGREDRVNVAVSNSPRSCVISGDPEAVRQMMSRTRTRWCVLPGRQSGCGVSQPPNGCSRPPVLVSELAGMATQATVACRSGRRSSADAPEATTSAPPIGAATCANRYYSRMR